MNEEKINKAEAGWAIITGQAKDRKKTIPYNPLYLKVSGNNVAGAILFQQITHRWVYSGSRPFYKFQAPCGNALYRKDDSWQEELGFTRSVFETARKSIHAKRITQGTSKSEAEKRYPIIYWIDSSRVTWYQVNEEVMGELTYLLYFDKDKLKARLDEIDGKEKSQCDDQPMSSSEEINQSILGNAGIPHSLLSESSSKSSSEITPTRQKTRVVGPPTAVDNPSSLSGEAEPTSTQDQLQKKDQRVLKRRIMPSSAKVHDHPGLVWTQDEDLLHVVDVNVEPEDLILTCPDCEESQEWPPSENRRRKGPALICHECGAYFRVHTEHNGRGKTYQLPIVGQEGRWMAHIDDVPYRVNSFPCTQAQAERLTSLWLEDAGTVRSLLVWIDKENLIQRAWRNHRDRIAGAVITGFKSRKQNSEGRKAAEQIHEEITTADSDVSALFEETK